MHISSKSLLASCVLLASLATPQISQAADHLLMLGSIVMASNQPAHTRFEKPAARTDQAVIATTPPYPGPTIPPHGGINPIGDVSCTQGEQILAADGFNVYSSNCDWYIYKFRATQGVAISEISMSSFTGEYTTRLIGIASN